MTDCLIYYSRNLKRVPRTSTTTVYIYIFIRLVSGSIRMSSKGNPNYASFSVSRIDKELATLIKKAYTETFDLENDVRIKVAKCFYQVQTCRTLRTEDNQIKIGIYLDGVKSEYSKHIEEAVRDINIAAPGLQLFTTKNRDEAEIEICENNREGCSTTQTMGGLAFIQLDTSWETDWKGQTTIHELLHALGFEHEFKRIDSGKYVDIKTNSNQYIDEDDSLKIRGLTRFDPFSVMMYPEEKSVLERRENGDKVWKLKPGSLPNKEMSELDKVALNMVFPPCKGQNYDPQLSQQTGMFYCGRNVMTGNQHPTPTGTDGKCGPTNWANCPACRVLKTIKCLEMRIKGKWQGWSGLFYCGAEFTTVKNYYKKGKSLQHDGFCGPNNGLPCNDCGKILYEDYNYEDEVKSEDK